MSEPDKPADDMPTPPPSTATNTTIVPPAGTLTFSSAIDTVAEVLAGNLVPLLRKLRNREPLTVREYEYLAEHFWRVHENSLSTDDRARQMAHQVNELRVRGHARNWTEAWGIVADYSLKTKKKSADVVRRAWQRWGKKTTIVPGDKD
jgi:hypothetical protein